MIARFAAPIVALCLLVLGSTALFAAEPTHVSLENEFVRVVVNRGQEEAGRFSIRTTGGDLSRPASRDKHLIFGGNAPWTSYTTLLIDGQKYAFGGPTKRRAGLHAQYGTALSEPTAANGIITTTYKYGDLEVTQELRFVRGLSTRMLDTVGITYKVANPSTTPHDMGLRVLLDTMCGSNDGAPIRAGSQAITTATGLNEKAVPDYWQAFDSLSKPTVISQGTLRGDKTTPPDQVVFADWGTLADEPWAPDLAPGQSLIRKGEDEVDTAAALYWLPVTIDPGQTRVFTTYYGIGEVSLKPGKLTLGLTAPAETTFLHERTQPITIAGYLQNAGDFDARDVALSITLPDGLTLVGGSKQKEQFKTLKADETVQASWVVMPNGKQSGNLQVTLQVNSANIEANQTERTVQVNVPKPTLQFTPATQRVPPITNRRPTIIPIQVNLSPAENFAGARFTVSFDPEVVKPFDVSRGRAFVEGGRLLAGWDFDDSRIDDGVVIITGKRTGAPQITQAEANLAMLNFRAVAEGTCTLKFEEAVLIDDKGQEAPVNIENGVIVISTEPTK